MPKLDVQTSSRQEKLIVFAGTIGAAVSGYLFAIGRPAEAALAGAVSAAIVAFWSEGVNTTKKVT